MYVSIYMYEIMLSYNLISGENQRNTISENNRLIIIEYILCRVNLL